jgi:probable DNA metabolism protein
MLVYTFDRTMDGVLTAVFDAYALRQQPEELVGEGSVLPLFCEEVHSVQTADDKAQRVWRGLEKKLSKEALRMLTVAWLSESEELYTPMFHYIYKVFKGTNERNFSDPDVLYVTNTARRVAHEQLRMKQFMRFQKAKDGTYLGVVSPDNDVLPLVIGHFQDRFNDQPFLIFDARRKYGYYYDKTAVTRVTFEDEATIPFSLDDGKLNDDLLSENDQLFQNLWRTYFKAICIRERMNPRKQLNDMPRRYWKYMTEKQE